MNLDDIPQEFRESEQIILPKQKEKIMTIEDLLGPESNYEAIKIDLKKLCSNKRYAGFVFSDDFDRGYDFSKIISQNLEGTIYGEANKEWTDIIHKYKIPVTKLGALSKALYCAGETEIAKRLDLGLTIDEQRNPEEYFKHITCDN